MSSSIDIAVCDIESRRRLIPIALRVAQGGVERARPVSAFISSGCMHVLYEHDVNVVLVLEELYSPPMRVSKVFRCAGLDRELCCEVAHAAYANWAYMWSIDETLGAIEGILRTRELKYVRRYGCPEELLETARFPYR
jgi:hypothetical protein